ncbi:ABC transporter ATP-binding protein [Micromonospora cathayae]|uniref:ABC transporter ATP-binding protein n=1 Tax=Micromonospora cathayae TaxID=3028804 RepID=A0ABY7ZUN3_9ACTN|nr:ABC transporter ATP-binding protein [Micromonospora sp. HUAS 3]WDZ86735.1 ABC transporter ATP-binding protein [Micromonospora sp. HUAS 3]
MSPRPTRTVTGPEVAARHGTALRVRGLDVTFTTRRGDVPAVRGVDLDVAAGEVLVLLGESGSGKSVTARAVMGLLDGGNVQVRADRIEVAGHDVATGDPDHVRTLRGSTMALVFQDALSALNPVLSIGDQLGEVFRLHRGASRRAARAEAVELLRLVGIPAPDRRVRDFPHQFSGGMRQRILIAMAVALGPRLLIADEPTTALDVTVQAQILDLIDRLRQELGMGVLLITHDLGVAAELADRVAVMYAGRIVETGTVADTLDHPAHPYTAALLRSVPDLLDPGEPLRPIPGSPPNLLALPDGCAFHPRCARADDRCRASRPPRRPLTGPDRTVACHHPEEDADAAV